MDEDEAARHAAEHKAAALHRIGWEEGAGATIWARAIQDNLALHESARERFAANTTNLESWERLHATALRHLVAHLDAYAVGEGWRQTGKQSPPISEKYLSPLIWWGDGEGTMLNLGKERLNLRTAAAAAIKLAQVVERARAEHLKRVEREANAALRRQYGLDEPD